MAGAVGDVCGGGKSESPGSGEAEPSDGLDGGRGRCSELADALVAGVGEGEEGGGRDCGAARSVEGGGSGGASVTREGLGAVAGDGGDDAGDGVDAADALVGGVREVKVSAGVEGEAVREGEGGAGRSGGVAGKGWSAGTSDGGDYAGGGVDAADAVVVGVGEVEVVCGVEREAGR